MSRASTSSSRAAALIAYGHCGRPLLAFPSEQGPAGQYEERGMIDAIAALLDAGRVKVYCVDSYDSWSVARHVVPLEERARRHGHYEGWILERRRAVDRRGHGRRRPS